MTAPHDTIAAIATAPGTGGVGIVRVSGAQAAHIAYVLLDRPPRPRYAHYATFRDANGDALDQGLLLFFPAPNSFTGEDVLELHAHGSPVVLRLLLKRMLELGTRMARPGEFSERAFLNGKMDLAQAEAVADLIASGSETAARAALRSLDGEFSKRVHALTENVIRLRIYIEAAIDFAEEEIDFLAAPQIHHDLEALRTQLTNLLTAAQRGVRLREGLHVVIIGRPNAGKSSLLNALATSDRAIVTEIPGTTRDLLRETIELDGIALTLVDTAGLRDSADIVEQEGIRRARAELEHADVVILVTDSKHVISDSILLEEVPKSATRIIAHNKIDLSHESPSHQLHEGQCHLWLSARNGAGLDLLREELKQCAGFGESSEGAFTARARHVAALEKASQHLANATHVLTTNKAGELAAEELRQVQHYLNEITGEFTTEDLLGRIFSSFCIGK